MKDTLPSALVVRPRDDGPQSKPRRLYPEVTEKNLQAAMRVANPALDRNHLDEYERASYENAARCQVRRVVAALSGVDVENDLLGSAAQKLDALVMVPREPLLRLRDAVMTEQMVAAFERQIGPEQTAELLGYFAVLV